MITRRKFWLSQSRMVAAVVLIGWLVVAVSPSSGQEAPGTKPGTKKDAETDAGVHRPFAEEDAVRLMDGMRQALESKNRGRFLKLFDAKRMPDYAVFRDQVTACFETYDAFQLRYHVTQAATDGEFGAAIATVVLDARPSDGVTPNVRKSVDVRLIAAWDGKQWKVVDLSPRTWLQ